MSTSEAQIAANRANAQLCTGPRTPEGKARSSQNARRHGVTGQTTIMTDEDRLHHDDFCNRMIAGLAPVGPMELFLASSIAEEAWRLNHNRAQCNNIIAVGHFDTQDNGCAGVHPEIENAVIAAETTRDNAKTLELLSLYAQRSHNKFRKHVADLKAAQSERLAKEAADLDDARLLGQLAVLNHLPYVPAQDGFVFSTDEIERYTERHHRLRMAKTYECEYIEHEKLIRKPKAA